MPTPIDYEKIPGADIQPDAIEENARTVGTISGQVTEHGSNVNFTWQGMAAVYEAPESPTLLGLMAPVSSQATQAGDNLAEVSAALVAFAADVRPIKAELDALRADAKTFVDSIQGGVQVREINPAWTAAQSPYGGASAVPTYQGSWGSSTTTAQSAPEQYRTVTKEWHESQEHVDRNNELLSAVNAQQVKLWEAERACANRIRALYGAAPLRAAQSEDDSLGYGISEIPEGTEMPWGAEVERTEGCGEATVNFVFKDFLWEGIAVGGIWGTVQGLGTLVLGYNPATGDFFSGEAYGAAWGNLGMLLFAGAANTGILAPIFQSDSLMQSMGMDGFLPQEVRDFKAQADEAAINTGKALIAWDKWQDDPGTALGESVFNVGTALIPVGGAAVAGVKTASTAASVVSKMARVVDFVDPAALALNGTMRLGGAGLHSLDGLIGRLGSNSTDGLHLDTPHMPLVADDATSALSALDGAGVDLGTVTARVDDGVPVYEFPPTAEIPSGRIEMPAGAFDGVHGGGVPVHTDVPVRIDGGADATVPAPVREPELVAAGGVRGESGPGPVNSIVEDAPVRTEPGGTGESTVVREPSTETSGGSHAGGQGGSATGNGGGGRGGDEVTGGGRGDDGVDEGRGDESVNARSDDDGATNADRSGDSHDMHHGDDIVTDEAATSGDGNPTPETHVTDDGVLRPDATDVGWRSSEDPHLTLSSDQKAFVDDYLAGSRGAEPRLTGIMEDLRSTFPEARLEGLEYRLKGDESLYRKVATELADTAPGVPMEQVLGSIKDSVRYTVVVPDASYGSAVPRMLDDLQSDGLVPYGKLKNSWGADGYQGINSTWFDPVGNRKIEVQFHTDASFDAKMGSHVEYEAARLPGTDDAVRAQLESAMNERFAAVPRPIGADAVSWPDITPGTGFVDVTAHLPAEAFPSDVSRTPLDDSLVDHSIIQEFQPSSASDSAVFWSGRVSVGDDFVSSMDGGRVVASSYERSTLEQMLERQGLADAMPSDWSLSSTAETWRAVSSAIAENAKGHVFAYVGDVRPGSVWNMYELPRLIENEAVTKITVIDAHTGRPLHVYER
jgi:hypothetical protein